MEKKLREKSIEKYRRFYHIMLYSMKCFLLYKHIYLRSVRANIVDYFGVINFNIEHVKIRSEKKVEQLI